MRSHEKFKKLYLHYKNAYEYQTWLECKELHLIKLNGTWLNEVFLQDHVTNLKSCIFTNTMYKATKRIRMVA